jgi:hypothetical protein
VEPAERTVALRIMSADVGIEPSEPDSNLKTLSAKLMPVTPSAPLALSESLKVVAPPCWMTAGWARQVAATVTVSASALPSNASAAVSAAAV